MLDITDTRLRATLDASLSVRRFVDEIARLAPFDSVDQLLRAAENAATPLSADEIDEALAHHPRIGETPRGDGVAQSLSRSEQASSDASDADLAAELAAANAAYENRFGRVFLIRAAGRSRVEILAELRRRLQLDDRTELRIVGEQLREIALLRLQTLLEDAPTGREDE